jgi:hypothetical protein
MSSLVKGGLLVKSNDYSASIFGQRLIVGFDFRAKHIFIDKYIYEKMNASAFMII